ncbi:DUF4124 domain-containing protein [Marinobacter mangrovi]|uniref:DUF4124 domain-containing protein n=1 Tax=Marinobacter mangrovi TaxID=2803918 RepID=UPI0019335A20|nr:DUF4124 domain-containing protein [Marinobacter mangrovi]
MRTSLLILMLGMGVCPAVSAAIYQCQGPNGQVIFSDSACSKHAKEVEVHPVTTGGRLDTGTDVDVWQPAHHASRKTSTDGCDLGYIQSTQLRTWRARRQVKTGMSAQQLNYVLGDPDHKEGQWWVYERRGKETGRYRVRGGCLVSWR